jgi:hypothetical protein
MKSHLSEIAKRDSDLPLFVEEILLPCSQSNFGYLQPGFSQAHIWHGVALVDIQRGFK